MTAAVDRKAAVAAYKERKPQVGVFAVRCVATGETWVGESRHVDNHRNGLWFALGAGSCLNRPLQAAFTAHGADAFSYEVLETLDPDLSPMARGTALKEAGALWREELKAQAV